MRSSAMVVMGLLGACTNDERTVMLPEVPAQSSVTIERDFAERDAHVMGHCETR